MILSGSFTRADERQYRHVPFIVPDGTQRIDVRYEYSERIDSDPRLTGGNTLDIGLFDQHGFRGWSGSHKLAFSVAETWATPAYVAGPITPGPWRVLLGPYKVSPRGCDYEISLTFSDDPGQPPDLGPRAVTTVRPNLPAAEHGWIRGDLHCHTVYSDGDSWPAEILAEAVSRGLDFLGVTDHNQVGHQADFLRLAVRGQGLPIILPGIEVTTYGGHWNAWGTSMWLDFREPTDSAVSHEMHKAAGSGAVVSVNHPKPLGPPWQYPNATGFHTVEVWNGYWLEHNDASLAWWDTLLRQGRRVYAVGGSDTHHLKGAPHDVLGHPTTWAYVGADHSLEGVLGALRSGQTFISRDVNGPQLHMSRDSVRVLGGNGTTLLLVSPGGVAASHAVTRDDWSGAVHIEREYVRAELRHGDEVLALSNPVFTA